MNQGLQDALKTLWVGLCFLALLAGCGDEDTEIEVEQESAGASRAEKLRTTTASAAKSVEQESPDITQAGEPRVATTSVAVPEVEFPEKHRAFFKTHCLDCHDSETQEGKVDLETLPFRITTIEQAELWQKVLGALNSGEMPPKDSEQLGNEEKADFLDDLSLTMVTARKVLSDSGGRITMRRLNKRDYQNSIESLLGVRLGNELLPDDGSSGDFDTVGASLFLSSDKFEQYLKLGRHAIDEFYERRAARNAKPFVYRVEPEKTLNVALRQRVERNEKYLKRFEALDAELEQALALPENKGFKAQVGARGGREQFYRQLDRHVSKLKGAPDPKDHGFGNFFAAAKFFPKAAPYDKHYAGLPHSETGT